MAGHIKNQFKGWNILVVDDEPDSLEVASRWLKIAGANVLTAENGRDGLEIAKAERPHFIIADLTMPVMDGWELLHELRQDPETAHIPVIALTAHAMQSVKQRAIQVGFVSHIPKPLSPIKFVDQVADIVREVPELAKQPAIE